MRRRAVKSDRDSGNASRPGDGVDVEVELRIVVHELAGGAPWFAWRSGTGWEPVGWCSAFHPQQRVPLGEKGGVCGFPGDER